MMKKYIILIPILLLFIISIIYLPINLKYKQLVWVCISFLLCFKISNIKLNKILKHSCFYYLISIILLIIVLVIGKITNGSKAWLSIGFINVQPSEFMKVALILFNLKYKRINIHLFNIYNILPMILIFLEPDTGGIITLLIIYLYFLFKRIKKGYKKYLFILLLMITLLTSYLIFFNKELLISIFGSSIIYRLERLTNFIRDDNIQSTNALVSIATSKLLYFPEMFNDFYISYLLSNNIYLICLIIICTTIILFILIKKNTIVSRIVFYIILWQCFYNLAMNLKLVPVIGIPYLFISYGGSHIITTMILIGLTISKGNKSMNLA